MSSEGTLGTRGLAQVLPELGRAGSTGILTIQGTQEIIALSFLKGGIVSADALNQTMEDGLGKVLSDLGLVASDQFAELAAEYQAGGGQVVDLLVERGFLEREQLLEAVRKNTYLLGRQALQWTEGDYKFYAGDEVSYEEGIDPLSPEELLTRATRELGADFMPGGAPADSAVYQRSRGAEPPVESGDAGQFAAVDRQVVSIFKLLNGKRSVADLADASGMPGFRVAYFVGRWEHEGLVELKGAAGASPDHLVDALADPLAGDELPAPARPSLMARLWSRAPAGGAPDALPWPSRLLGLLFVVGLLWTFGERPVRMLLPFPWQSGVQDAADRERAGAVLSRVRLANGAHFLLHGRFAEEMSELATAGLLPPALLVMTSDRGLSYSATEDSYVLTWLAGGQSETVLQESVRGDFLLDPELEPPSRSRRAPLVLLD